TWQTRTEPSGFEPRYSPQGSYPRRWRTRARSAEISSAKAFGKASRERLVIKREYRRDSRPSAASALNLGPNGNPVSDVGEDERSGYPQPQQTDEVPDDSYDQPPKETAYG